jgi:hypothetical protein
VYILSFNADIFKTGIGSPWKFCHPDLLRFAKPNLAPLGLLLQPHAERAIRSIVGLFEGLDSIRIKVETLVQYWAPLALPGRG